MAAVRRSRRRPGGAAASHPRCRPPPPRRPAVALTGTGELQASAVPWPGAGDPGYHARPQPLTEVERIPIPHRIERLAVRRRRAPVNRLLVGVWTAGLVFSLAAWAAAALLVVALVR